MIRRSALASLSAIGVVVGVTTACGSHRHGSTPEGALSDKQLAQAIVSAESGKQRKFFSYRVKLDSAAFAVANAAIRDEYETRNCAGSQTLFVPPVAMGGGVSVDPNQCTDYVADHSWFVAGTMRVVRDCVNDYGPPGPAYIVKTSECLQFKVVGKQRGLVGKGMLSYPWERMQIQLARSHGNWRIASEDQLFLANANGYRLWLHRVK